MHQYIETVRSEIETSSGQESYLSSALFQRIFKDLNYEDGGKFKLQVKEDYEKIQFRAMNSLNNSPEFNIKDEILAWQAAILRDIAREYYYWWVDYKEEKFRAPNFFQDGEACLTIESNCEKLNENPTEIYSQVLEVEILMNSLCTSCNTLIFEIDRFWQFRYQNSVKAELNDFMKKRISNESKHTMIFKSIDTLQSISDRFAKFGKRMAGADHLLWINPHHMLQALIQALNGFLKFEYVKDMDLSLSDWLNQLFPRRLNSGQPNPIYQSALHNQVIAKLSQATACLLQHTAHKVDSFKQRDEVLRPFVFEMLEKTKQQSLINMPSVQDKNRQQNNY